MCVYMCVYTFICVEREREREGPGGRSNAALNAAGIIYTAYGAHIDKLCMVHCELYVELWASPPTNVITLFYPSVINSNYLFTNINNYASLYVR